MAFRPDISDGAPYAQSRKARRRNRSSHPQTAHALHSAGADSTNAGLRGASCGCFTVGSLSAEAVVREYEAAAKEMEAMGAELMEAARKCEAMTAEVHKTMAFVRRPRLPIGKTPRRCSPASKNVRCSASRCARHARTCGTRSPAFPSSKSDQPVCLQVATSLPVDCRADQSWPL